MERVGASHYGSDRQEAGEEKARRIVLEEMQRLGWQEDDLLRRRKGDEGKVKVAPPVESGNAGALKVDSAAFAHGRLDVCV